MAIDFPASPTVGQLFKGGSLFYEFDGVAWNIAGGAGGALLRAQEPNLLVNPAMQISQQNGVASGTADGYALADQWFMYFLSAATVTAQRVAAATPRGSDYRLRMTITVADATVTTDYIYLQQPLEGQMISRAKFGSAAAKPLVLRFGWKSPAGNYAVTIRNDAFNRSLVIPFTVSATEANTDIERTLVIPPDVTGTWPTDNTRSMTVSFAIVGGVQTTPNVWTAGNFVGYAGMSNGGGTAAAVFELFDVGLHLDPYSTGVAPDFVVPEYSNELRKAMRYWELSGPGAGVFSGNVTSGSTYYASRYYTPKRVIPTITPTNANAGSFPAAAGTIIGIGIDQAMESRVANATGAGLFQTTFVVNARM